MNRRTKIISRCCREPVFWAALLVAGFGAWLYGHEADYPAAQPVRAPHPALPAQQPEAGAIAAPDAARARRGGGDAVARPAAPAAPDAAKAKRLMREADALVVRGDALLFDAGLPEGFLDRAVLNPETIRRALEDADERLRRGSDTDSEDQHE